DRPRGGAVREALNGEHRGKQEGDEDEKLPHGRQGTPWLQLETRARRRYDRGLTTTGVPRRGEKVTLRRAMPSGRRRAPRSSQRRSVSRRTTRISNSAKEAPRQRRTPPPKGIQE